jgi:hypothetical protein
MTRIEPEEPGFILRAYDCGSCAWAEIVIAKLEMRSSLEGTASAEP